MTKQQSTKQFLEWARKNAPGFYAELGKRVSGLGETQDSTPWYDKIINAASNLATAYYQNKTQQEIIEMQLERAKQGLPPIQADQYAAPPVRVQHEVAMPGGQQTPVYVKYALYGIVGIGAVFLLSSLMGSKS